MDDKGYSSTLADQFGLEFSGHTLYDGEAYATELDYNFIWVNTRLHIILQQIQVLSQVFIHV